MALIKCPECGMQISNDAIACPHCGKPLKEETFSRLNSNYDGRFRVSTFFKVMAYVTWVCGFVLAIVWGITMAGYHSDFNWIYFLSVLIGCGLLGGGTYCISVVVDYIYGIYSMLASLELKKNSRSNASSDKRLDNFRLPQLHDE